jgi:hypothetical protein
MGPENARLTGGPARPMIQGVPHGGPASATPAPAEVRAATPERDMGTNNRSRKPPDLEAKLDREVQAIVGKGPGDYSPEDWRSLREQLRMSILYPGKVVAFRDHYEGEGDSRRLVRREILCASRSGMVVSKFVDQLPQREQQDVYMDCVEPRNTGRRGH